MKSHFNDYVKKSNKPKKKNVIKRKNNSLIINNHDIFLDKTNYSKNIKKVIKSRHNSTKEVTNGIKKSFNCKLYLNTKLRPSKENDLQTINPGTLHIQKNLYIPPKKTKIIIIKKKEHPHQRNNSSINNLLKDNNINDKLTKETKITNNFSISTGLSNGTGDKDKEFLKNLFDSEEKNKGMNVNNYNYNADSNSNKLEALLFEEKTCNVNNFCYETISKEDSNENGDKIILKCDNYSMLTFGNSFSYSNSQKRKTNKKFLNNENNKSNNKYINMDKINDNSYVNKLKLENETLKKELQESAQQISFLMNQIKDLKDNSYLPIKKSCKKTIQRNISAKTNKTKESYDIKIKNLLMRKNKLNDIGLNNNKNITKSNSIVAINSKKNKIRNNINANRNIDYLKKSKNTFQK